MTEQQITQLTPADIDAIASAVAARMALSVPAMPVPISSQLWTPDQCASYLGMSQRNFQERTAKTAGFPEAIRTPLPKGKKSRPKYRADQIIEWARKHQAGKTTAAGGRPREN